jgi:arginase family enzyme
VTRRIRIARSTTIEGAMEQITTQTNVHDLIRTHPHLKRVFDELGFSLDMTCLDKADNALKDVAVICGFDVDEMPQELNRALEKAK